MECVSWGKRKEVKTLSSLHAFVRKMPQSIFEEKKKKEALPTFTINNKSKHRNT